MQRLSLRVLSSNGCKGSQIFGINYKPLKYLTMATNFLSDSRVYVGTWAKYNAGSLAGAWLNLSDFSDYDAFMAACAALHSDEAAPEYMFQDCEGIPSRFVSGDFVDVRGLYDAAEDLDGCTDDEAEAVRAYWDEVDSSADVGYILDRYMGQYDSEEDYAEELYTECDQIPESLINYIDWARVARDLFFDYHFANGHVFSC